MKKNIIVSVFAVLVIIGITAGVTYAYLIVSDTKEFAGKFESGIMSSLSLTTVHSSNELVPLLDSKVGTAISKSSNKCVDKNNYNVCSLYTITLSNTGDLENLYGYVKTTNSTYTSNNLKYQIYDSSYNAITDVMTLSKTSDELVYFKKNSVQFSLASSGTNVYNLVIWLSDTNSEQSGDYSKSFSGKIGF